MIYVKKAAAKVNNELGCPDNEKSGAIINAADVAKESLLTVQSTKEIILERNLMSEERLDELLSPISMTKPGFFQN